jgi:hypothetical protein
MAGGQYLTPHQRGIVKRFYEHRETLAQQKLGEIVSDLYLCETDAKADRLWKRVEKALGQAGGNDANNANDPNGAWVKKILAERNLKELARIVGELF